MSEYLTLCLSLVDAEPNNVRTIRSIEDGAGLELTDRYLLFLDQVCLFILLPSKCEPNLLNPLAVHCCSEALGRKHSAHFGRCNGHRHQSDNAHAGFFYGAFR